MKKIFLLIFFIVALVNSSFYLKTAESASPSIKEVSRTKEDQATNKNWNWEFEITTESIVDNEKMVVDIYKLKDGKSSRISSKQYVIKNNYLVYSTDYILEDKTEYMIFFSIANTNPIVTKQFTSKTGSADPGNTTNIPINVDPAKGAGDEGNDNTYTLLAPIGEFTTAPDNFGDYLNIIFKIAIGLCAALAVIMIVLGGISYMGNESIFGKTEAKSKISAAILGLIIALGAYALLNTIDPNLLGKNGVQIDQVSAEIDNETETKPWDSNGAVVSGKTKLCEEGYVNVTTYGNPSTINVCLSISQNLKKLIEEAKKAGYILSGSGSRTYDQQVQIRKDNGCKPDLYKSPSKNCKPETARPGHSKHESGKAIDFKCNGKSIGGTSCFTWMKNNAKSFGFYNLKSEPWHWSDDGH